MKCELVEALKKKRKHANTHNYNSIFQYYHYTCTTIINNFVHDKFNKGPRVTHMEELWDRWALNPFQTVLTIKFTIFKIYLLNKLS